MLHRLETLAPGTRFKYPEPHTLGHVTEQEGTGRPACVAVRRESSAQRAPKREKCSQRARVCAPHFPTHPNMPQNVQKC